MARNQTDLPIEGEGVSRKQIKALEDAIDEWNSVKERRMKLTETEVEKKSAVLALMHKHELKEYFFGEDADRKVVLKDMVKVERIKTLEDEDEE